MGYFVGPAVVIQVMGGWRVSSDDCSALRIVSTILDRCQLSGSPSICRIELVHMLAVFVLSTSWNMGGGDGF